MNILIMGTGYVGVTTGLVFAELGWKVTGLDPDHTKIHSLSQGKLTFYEPGLDALLLKHLDSGLIRFTTDPETAIRESSVIFLCVGTPSTKDGSADLQFVRQAAENIGRYMQEYKLIAIKSTVPIETNQKLIEWIGSAQPNSIAFDVVSNPEFLREGSALQDALNPDRIIIGSSSEQAVELMKALYKKTNAPFFVTKAKTAEMIKYASNAFLATKISYVNELSRLCEHLEVDIYDVAEGMGMDPRIGRHFLRAGIGYGGSCFPKDIHALLHTAKQYNTELAILEKVTHVNQTQTAYFLNIWKQLLGTYHNKKIAILGISFKPNTDDLREAPSMAIIQQLLESGAVIRAHDPAAKLPSAMLSQKLQQFDLVEDTIDQCDAIILCSEWELYTKADWAQLKFRMKQHFIFDGRNVLDGKQLTALGYHYHGVGRVVQ